MGEAGAPTAFWAAVPDLAVEIISPSNSTQQIRERADDFLAAGTPLVWVIDPGPREVAVYRPGEQVKVYGEQQRLECAELPGFSCSVAELFG
jgi:Uma2 family endonuclease